MDVNPEYATIGLLRVVVGVCVCGGGGGIKIMCNVYKTVKFSPMFLLSLVSSLFCRGVNCLTSLCMWTRVTVHVEERRGGEEKRRGGELPISQCLYCYD